MTVVTLLGPGWAVPIRDGMDVISAIFTVRGFPWLLTMENLMWVFPCRAAMLLGRVVVGRNMLLFLLPATNLNFPPVLN